MNFFRKHWYDLGGALALIVGIGLYINRYSLTGYQWLMWCSLISLFLHQLEEYRIVRTFPGMINKVMYNSVLPDRYPLNTNTALYVNVFVGWIVYLLAAILAEKAIWLGIATLLVSAGNIIAHTIVFNWKGKTVYNAGLATSWLFFAPCLFFFFKIVQANHLITLTDLVIGIPLGIVLNVVGILKMITWFADKNTPYVFEQRNLLQRDRK
ncbi:HXXEE domain-containing protein [Fluviicola sp.]|uniref:HXXEE domain-containing protein n=1 Tax=Fluviicola sp. TaxID=1917219 RepID=UPI0031CFFBF7